MRWTALPRAQPGADSAERALEGAADVGDGHARGREPHSSTAGGDIALEGLSAGAFRVLLRYLYTQELLATDDGGEGLAVGEMPKAADYF